MKSTELAAYVASKVMHDLSSPLTAVMAGIDTVLVSKEGDPMFEMSSQLVRDGLEKMSAQLHFLRYVIGSQELNDNQASLGEVQARANEFARMRDSRSIVWSLETDRISNTHMRLLLNMALIAFEPVGKGGEVGLGAREEGADLVLEAVALGKTNGWNHRIPESINGEAPDGGWGGGKIQPYFARLIAEEAGFSLAEGDPGRGASLIARGPAPHF